MKKINPYYFLYCIIITLFFSIPSIAQEVEGFWSGELEVQGNKIPLAFDIKNESEKLTATLNSKAMGAIDVPFDEVSFENSLLLLKLNSAGVTYSGTLSDNTVTGNFEQGGQSLPLVLTRSEKKLPGDAKLPSSEEELAQLAAYDKGTYKYTVADYFANPNLSQFNFSPNGNYLSYKEKDENLKNHVYIKNLDTDEVTKVIVEGDDLIRAYGWVNNERLVYLKDKGGDENYHIYAIDITGKNEKVLTPFEGVKANFLELLKDDKDHIIISMNKENPQIFEPYKLNVVNGDLKKLYTNTDPANSIQSYLFDKTGNLRGFTKLKNGVDKEVYYRINEEFKLIRSLSWKDKFGVVSFDYATPYPDDAYIISNLDSDKTEILLYDLKTDKVLRKIYGNSDYDISDLSISRFRDYELDFVAYEGEKEVVVPVSDYFKRLHEKFSDKFKGYEYAIVDRTDDESKWLLIIISDKLPGTYYEYDAKKDEFKLLVNLLPQLKEEDMAKMRPITFKSRDGLTLHGYITLPSAALQGRKVPLIVNPHGGPQSVRDSWGFNPEAQLFASRGYATLQVNFRISGGYGKQFLEAGFKQIGRKVMDDIEDGVQYVVDQGWIDKDKVAIYGVSHGGYAVLRGLAKTPDLYACGVDYVGISNINTLFASVPDYWKPYLEILKEVWYDADIPEEKAIIEEVSPLFHVDKIKKPLLVVQGANDPRVNINESDQIVQAMRLKGYDVPYIVKYDEGHGFSKEENRIELYKIMIGFFAKHLN